MTCDGKVRVALYTIKHVDYGCVLSYDYHCNTDDITEYYNSKCLCGAEACNTLYLSLTAAHFDAILESNHTMLHRFAMLARACERYAVKSNSLPKSLANVLASVGFGDKIFRESPMWLKFYCAHVIEFIKLERSMLPNYLLSKAPTIYTTEELAGIEADGVYGLRLQNLAITIDRVLSFLRRHPDHAVPPLYPHTDQEVARRLVFGEQSIWLTLKEFVDAHERKFQKCQLKETLNCLFEEYGKGKRSLEAARQVLRRTAAALRDAAAAYAPVAAVLQVRRLFSSFSSLIFVHSEQDLADTKTFYLLSKYDDVKTEALQLSAEDVETGANVQLPASACLRVEEQLLPPHFVLGQLLFWYHQPQRKSDVLCLHGAGELPCPTNILRCCCTGVGLSIEEQQRNQELLSGTAVPLPARRLRVHQFASNISDAFIGCTALGNAVQQLQATGITGTKHSTNTRPHVEQPCLTSPIAPGDNETVVPWFEAEQILAEKQVPLFNKKRNVMLYLVRWRGHPPPADSWEPKENLSPELFNEWVNELRPSDGALTSDIPRLPPPLEFGSPKGDNVSMHSFRSQDLGWSVVMPLHGCVTGHIYGSDIYTDDSDVSTAALHAGVLQLDEKKMVRVYITGPRRSFRKSLRNGIQSHRFNYFAGSFTFDEETARALCSANANKKRRVCQSEELEAAALPENSGDCIESPVIDNVSHATDDDILIYEWGP